MHRIRRCVIGVFAFVVCLNQRVLDPSALAQDIAMNEQPEVVDAPDVVVSATKTPTPAKQVTSAVEVITGEDMQQRRLKTVYVVR